MGARHGSLVSPVETTVETQAQMAPTPSRRRWEGLRTVLLALLIGFSVRVGIAQAYVVEGPSMEPTLTDHERVWVAKYAYGLSVPGVTDQVATWAAPTPGDVVIVNSPMDGLDLVKRVIGVGGDRIDIRDGRIYRNGELVPEHMVGPCDPSTMLEADPTCEVFEETVAGRSYRTSRSPESFDYDLSIEVPRDHVFVMGDHRDRSNDSRTFGPIPLGRLRGRVLGLD
jgi:signal peptidase I